MNWSPVFRVAAWESTWRTRLTRHRTLLRIAQSGTAVRNAVPITMSLTAEVPNAMPAHFGLDLTVSGYTSHRTLAANIMSRDTKLSLHIDAFGTHACVPIDVHDGYIQASLHPVPAHRCTYVTYRFPGTTSMRRCLRRVMQGVPGGLPSLG